MAHAPLLVVGLDGASLALVERWVADDRLRVLGSLLDRGAYGLLRSTVPAATFPAWTSMTTGVNPGRHGVLDFAERVPGTLHVRFVNGSHRAVPAFWGRLASEGVSTVVVTVPATYPPEALRNGVMVSGFDTPLTATIDGTFVHPKEKWAAISRDVGSVPFADFQEVQPGPGWHDRAAASLLAGIEQRTRLVEYLIRSERPAACMVVFGESDTASHHFWRFYDRRSPRWVESPWSDVLPRVYEALDGALGRLIAAFGEAPNVVVVSDHGSGGAAAVGLHLNRRLAEAGLLRFTAATRARGAERVRRAVLRWVPFSLQASLLRRFGGIAGRLEGANRFGAIDWEGTVAYSEELDYHPSVWLNLKGREPLGRVDPTERVAVLARVEEALRSWRDADGAPVLSRIWRREEVYAGPYTEEAPDLLLEAALRDGYSPSWLRSHEPGPTVRPLRPHEMAAGKGAGMNGAHRADGLYLLAGPDVRRLGRSGDRPIVDVAPTLLALAGGAVPRGLDGVPMSEALRAEVRWSADDVESSRPVQHELDPAEERAVARRLAALGYIDDGEDAP